MQNSMAAEGRCSLFGGSCLMVWIPPHPPHPNRPPIHTHIQALQLSGVFRPVILNPSCALELPGELQEMGISESEVELAWGAAWAAGP